MSRRGYKGTSGVCVQSSPLRLEMLSDSESDSDGNVQQLTINEHYERAFNARKEREELWKCMSNFCFEEGEFELIFFSGRKARRG